MIFKKTILASVLSLITMTACASPSVETTSKSQDDTYQLMELFGSVFQSIKADYVEEPSDRKMIESAINGMLSALDPHSAFMNLEDFEDLETQTKGEFGGLGLEVSSDNGLVRVVSPIDDTPAFRAGIQTGDYITHIDGESVIGLTLTEAVKKMRGPVGTKITLTISRKDKEPFDVKIKRDTIKVSPVKFEAKGDVGYIRISSFAEKTVDELHHAIQQLNKQIGEDKIVGFVLDVRNNPGGLLDQAIGTVDTFITQGEIVSTRSRKPEDTARYSAKTGDMTNGKPLVVLINEGSASASEIVAGALQDHKRALIVGLKSFGKGSVQTVKSIDGFGGIKMTIARYYTPSGRSIQAKGIEPDIVIPRAKLKEEPVIKGFGEGNLPGAISAEEGKKASETKQKENDKKIDKSDKKDDKSEEKQDYQLDRAIDILRGVAIYQQK